MCHPDYPFLQFLLTQSLQFDPLDLGEWLPADYGRKAELSNGRSAMLAVVGWVWPKYFGLFDSSDVTTTDPIDAILQADPQWWAQFILLCGTIEGYKYNAELNGKSFVGEVRHLFSYVCCLKYSKISLKFIFPQI